MPSLTPNTIWNLTDIELQRLLSIGAIKPKSDTIRFYAPSFTYYRTKHFVSSTNEFPTISVTGHSCLLDCKHCGGRVLETMHAAISPNEMLELGLKLKANGAKGVLVSGGCSPDGSVPLERFVPVLKRFKQDLGFIVFVHTGITKAKIARELKDAKVDAVLIDIVGSEETIEKTLELNACLQDYANSLRAFREAKLNTVPHVIVGLNEGKLDGEYSALRLIQQNSKPSALVIIAFMPIAGTEMSQTAPPKPIDIARVVATARLMFPHTPLAIGCMRPKGKSRVEIDILSLKAGADAVAYPSEDVIGYAKSKGYTTAFSPFCCAQLFKDLL